MTAEHRPVAITMGDSSGVGPEIVLRSFANGQLDDDVVIYGDASVLRAGAAILGMPDVVDVVDVVDSPGLPTPGRLAVVDLARLTDAEFTPGVLSAASGAAARDYVERATRDALDRRVSAIVTMPMNKEATQRSDPGFVGHTEFIATLCGTEKVAMMLTNGPLAVTHVSTHCSLRTAIERVRTPRVLDVITLTDATLRRFLAT